MATTHQPLNQWCGLSEKILQCCYLDLPYRCGEVMTYAIISQDCHHFMLVQEGWENNRRVHGFIVHAQIRHDKIWIHYDGIEDGITAERVAAVVPKERIVLAFHPPEV